MVTHSTLLLPLRMTLFRTLNSPGLLITVSTRRTRPDLSYILSQFSLCRRRHSHEQVEMKVERPGTPGSEGDAPPIGSPNWIAVQPRIDGQAGQRVSWPFVDPNIVLLISDGPGQASDDR